MVFCLLQSRIEWRMSARYAIGCPPLRQMLSQLVEGCLIAPGAVARWRER